MRRYAVIAIALLLAGCGRANEWENQEAELANELNAAEATPADQMNTLMPEPANTSTDDGANSAAEMSPAENSMDAAASEPLTTNSDQ